MGRRFAQKAAEPAAEQADPRWWQYRVGGMGSGLPAPLPEAVLVQGAVDAQKASTAELVKAAVREALHVETVPLEAATIEAFDPGPPSRLPSPRRSPRSWRRSRRRTRSSLSRSASSTPSPTSQTRPRPLSPAWRSTRFTRQHARRASLSAEIAERTQQMMIRHLETSTSAPTPTSGEAARATLASTRGEAPDP